MINSPFCLSITALLYKLSLPATGFSFSVIDTTSVPLLVENNF
jgi:hypothetical protein